MASAYTMTGELSNSGRKHPFQLTLSEGMARYAFVKSPMVLTLHLKGDRSTFEETRDGKTRAIPPERYSEKILETDLRYEDLSLRFLYWTNAQVVGETIVTANPCWKVEVKPAADDPSQYSRVVLYVGRSDAALMKAEAYGRAGEFARRFQVVSGMRKNGVWFLKEMRIEAFDSKFGDRTPTYLRIHEVTDNRPTGGG
jgi:hypothetical protein